jgi:RND family efflux transporter MFP subunit
MQPWVAAKIGPQFVSAYLGAVLVRPGASVRRGEVLATLDCRESSAATREIAARAKALEERQVAAEHEATRLKELTASGFASTNEAEQLAAKSKSEAADIEGLRASLTARSLQVDDCVLRAPFGGEIAERLADPGAYVRPGNPVVTAIDRSTIRVVADAPESDFAVVAPGTKVTLTVLATGTKLSGAVSRRAPAADDATRTVHFEIDLPNTERALPVGTTAVIGIEVGEPRPATAVPLRAATLRADQASLFVVEGGLAKRKTIAVVGEAAGTLYVDPKLTDGSAVVVEGRALLDDGDSVAAKEITD